MSKTEVVSRALTETGGHAEQLGLPSYFVDIVIIGIIVVVVISIVVAIKRNR